MSKAHAYRILLAVPALLLFGRVAQAQTSPLHAAPSPVALTYQLPSTAGSAVAVKITATSSTYFTIDPSTVPIWLSLDASNGTATTTGATVNFTPNAVGGSLAAGTYGGTVHVKVTGFADLTVPVSLVVSNPAPTLTISQGSSVSINWTPGTAYPTSTLTAVSSDQPIAFTVSTAVTAPSTPNWIKTNRSSGVAYSFGTPIVVSFVQSVFDNANVGDSLTGTVTVTPAGGSAIDVAFTITVTPPSAVITRIFPTQTPTQASSPSSVNVVVSGTGFIPSTGANPTAITLTVGSGSATPLSSGAVNVVSADTMILTIPGADLGADAAITITAQNGNIGSPVTATLTVTSAPIIYSVTDAASLVEASPGSSPTFAPYEMITIFGANFGVGSGNNVSATTDSFGRYPNTLTANSHPLTVSFFKADGTTLIANAYLLFATDTQINAFVPSGVVGNSTVNIAVNYNSVASANYAASVAAADPGMFTVNSSGQGQGAILLSADYSVNSASNKAAKGSTVLLYLAGMGAPNSTATNTAGTSAPTFPGGCISTASYISTENGLSSHPSPPWTTLDGAVIASANLATNKFPPCFASSGAVSVTIGGFAATVSYAGFVADSVAGLYQINVVVPSAVTSGTAVPVVVTMGSAKSQAGVTMAVQ